MKQRQRTIYPLACSLMLAAISGADAREPLPVEIVAGYIANASLKALQAGPSAGTGINLKAKLDTGADISSINAPIVEHFSRDGRPWVRFEISGLDGKAMTVEKEIIRTVRIKRSGTVSSTRPVIKLTICVAGQTGETEFTLSDRRHLDYQLLIGRTFLQGRILVDSGRQMMHPGACPL